MASGRASDVVNKMPINNNLQIQVTIKRAIPYSFEQVLGLTSGLVKVSASAELSLGCKPEIRSGAPLPRSSGRLAPTAGSDECGGATP
jgi:hypothetical protein